MWPGGSGRYRIDIVDTSNGERFWPKTFGWQCLNNNVCLNDNVWVTMYERFWVTTFRAKKSKAQRCIIRICSCALEFFPESALGDGPKNSWIRVKLRVWILWQNDLWILETLTKAMTQVYPTSPQSISTAFDCYARCKDTINYPEPTCPEDGKYRTPNSCSSFYFCSNRIRFPNIKCPFGLHFNGTDCDWPSEANCPLIETDPVRNPRQINGVNIIKAFGLFGLWIPGNS